MPSWVLGKDDIGLSRRGPFLSWVKSLGGSLKDLSSPWPALKGTNLRGQTPICGFLRVAAVFCGFLRKSAFFFEKLRFPNASFSRKRRESAKICVRAPRSLNRREIWTALQVSGMRGIGTMLTCCPLVTSPDLHLRGHQCVLVRLALEWFFLEHWHGPDEKNKKGVPCLGVPKPGCFKPVFLHVLRGSALFSSFVPFCFFLIMKLPLGTKTSPN